MKKEHEYFTANQALWDAKTRVHVKSDFYDQEAFMAGKSSLQKIELNQLPNLKGLRVLHSQCHFGQDTLSMQRMGASCVGIDLSPVAIETAQTLNAELGLDATFHCTNVYDLDKVVTEKFDFVFTSYGVIGWLPDLNIWAEQMAARLKPGGLFHITEFHPMMYMYDWEKHRVSYRYFNNGEPYEEVEDGTYADKNSKISMKEYFWQHSMGDVLSALMKNGLELTGFSEYDYSPYDVFEKSQPRAENEYIFQDNGINIPLVFSVNALKK